MSVMTVPTSINQQLSNTRTSLMLSFSTMKTQSFTTSLVTQRTAVSAGDLRDKDKGTRTKQVLLVANALHTKTTRFFYRRNGNNKKASVCDAESSQLRGDVASIIQPTSFPDTDADASLGKHRDTAYKAKWFKIFHQLRQFFDSLLRGSIKVKHNDILPVCSDPSNQSPMLTIAGKTALCVATHFINGSDPQKRTCPADYWR